MIKQLLFKGCKAIAYIVILFTSYVAFPQCLVVNNPASVCQPATVNLTAAAVTAGSTAGTLSYWTNAAATTPLANPSAVSASGTYYIKNVTPTCTEVKPVTVAVLVNQSANPVLFCDGANTTATTVAFDFNNIGQSSFSYSYTIDGGAPITGSLVAPSHFNVPVTNPGSVVVFTLTWNNICGTPTKTATCNSTCTGTVTPNFTGMVTSYCQNVTPPAGALPPTSAEGITGTWTPATINTATVGTSNYTFKPNLSMHPCAVNKIVPITITQGTTLTYSYPATICQNFTFPALPATINGINGTWNPTSINTTTTGQKSAVFTPNAGQCAAPFTLTTQVNAPDPIQFSSLPTSFSICQNATAPSLGNLSTNGFAGTWDAASIDTSVANSITTYTFTASAGQCNTSPTYQTTVTVTPLTVPSYAVDPFCEGGVPPQGLALPTNLGGVIGTWTPSGAIDNSTFGNFPYTFTPAANQCSQVITINVVINQKVVPVFATQQIPPFCAGTTPVPTLPTTSDNGITGTWSPATIDNTQTQSYLFVPDAPQCATTANMTVTVNPPDSPGFTDLTFCVNDPAPPTLQTTSPLGITGTWNPATIDNTIPSATYEFTPDAGQCATNQTITVTVNQETLVDVTWTVTNYFSDNATVTFTVINPGSYFYRLDDGPISETNVFHNVAPGEHSITVYDINGCSPPITKTDEVIVIGYPHFFTPNGDGVNDYWNIYDLKLVNQGQATIHIFDRYGKFLKQIAPSGAGWDGTYNGQPLPSADYWFVVKYNELTKPSEFKAHFSLKR